MPKHPIQIRRDREKQPSFNVNLVEEDKKIEKEIEDGTIPDPAEMMLDPEGTGGLRPMPMDDLGDSAAGGEPDAALRSMDVDAKATTMDANIVKPKGGEI